MGRVSGFVPLIVETLALVLMTASGLILRSFARLLSVDLGFDTANVLTVEVEPLEQTAAVRREYYVSGGGPRHR